MFELKGKVALVTGAASGIGFAFVKELLRNELKGVALVDIDADNGQRALNEITTEFKRNCAIFVKADVTDREQLNEAFETTVKTFKQLDIVINNAGIIQERVWEKCVAVNLVSETKEDKIQVFLLNNFPPAGYSMFVEILLVGVITGSMLAMENFFPKYKNSSEAVIVNTASAAAFMGCKEMPVYAAAKYGVVGFTRSLGMDVHYQRTKVRVLAVCPGLVETPIINFTQEQLPEPYFSLSQKMRKDWPFAEKAENLAKHVMEMIKGAASGTIWLAMNGNCVEVKFPNYLDVDHADCI